jgi:hypothetical protein
VVDCSLGSLDRLVRRTSDAGGGDTGQDKVAVSWSLRYFDGGGVSEIRRSSPKTGPPADFLCNGFNDFLLRNEITRASRKGRKTGAKQTTWMTGNL